MHKRINYGSRALTAITLVVVFMFVAGTPVLVSAVSNNTSISSSVAQSYTADPNVQTGMIVEFKPGHTDTVIPLSNQDIKNMLGVVVPAANAAIVLSPQTSKTQQVLVASVGKSQVLVSSQNGPIKPGDYITISAVAGIGMKADGGESQVIGKATSAFTAASDVIGTVNLHSKHNGQTTVALGRINVDLNVSHNPLAQTTINYLPAFVNSLANNVANKQVSVLRIYFSLALLIMTAFVTANMLYGGIRGSIVAIGRNPLSRQTIFRSMAQTIIAGLAVFIAGMFAVYLLLKL